MLTKEASHNICIGVGAGRDLTTGSRNILIGVDAGKSLLYGDNNLVIGDGVDVPDPWTSNYVNIMGLLVLKDGQVIKNMLDPVLRDIVLKALGR